MSVQSVPDQNFCACAFKHEKCKLFVIVTTVSVPDSLGITTIMFDDSRKIMLGPEKRILEHLYGLSLDAAVKRCRWSSADSISEHRTSSGRSRSPVKSHSLGQTPYAPTPHRQSSQQGSTPRVSWDTCRSHPSGPVRDVHQEQNT